MNSQQLEAKTEDERTDESWCMGYWKQAGYTEMCESCTPGSRGKNCWELDMSLCCQQPRENCEQCHIYLSHLRESARIVRVTIALDTDQQISGQIHVPTDERLSEFINQTDRKFLPVTGLKDDPRIPKGEFMLINTDAIRYLLPHKPEPEAPDTSD